MKSHSLRRTLLKVGLAVTAGMILIATGASAQGQPEAEKINAKIHPWVIENTRAGVEAEFFVVLERQADLSGATK
ncbi:MAG TPA: hypothetical protein VJ885_17915, partial [Thermoanaerobaculia bacterium]|nr:hypothetical protein [Thermoanaerobaculia bacterium]